jgi:dTDP-4-dehydrorhamnose 3,5-epimerase
VLLERADIEGVVVITPQVHCDNRGYFYESFRADEFARKVSDRPFVQENQSLSEQGVIRGLHYQRGDAAQAKLVRVVEGCVRDVVVDLRKDSPTYGRWQAFELSAENYRQLYIPRGLAHGFAVLSPRAVLQYKCDAYYAPEAECGLLWCDTTLNIDWGIEPSKAIISAKDTKWPSWDDCPKF